MTPQPAEIKLGGSLAPNIGLTQGGAVGGASFNFGSALPSTSTSSSASKFQFADINSSLFSSSNNQTGSSVFVFGQPDGASGKSSAATGGAISKTFSIDGTTSNPLFTEAKSKSSNKGKGLKVIIGTGNKDVSVPYYFDKSWRGQTVSDANSNTLPQAHDNKPGRTSRSRSSSNSPDISHMGRVSHRIAASFTANTEGATAAKPEPGSRDRSAPKEKTTNLGATASDKLQTTKDEVKREEGVTEAPPGDETEGGATAGSSAQTLPEGATGMAKDTTTFSMAKIPTFSLGIAPGDSKKCTPPSARKNTKKVCRNK